MTRGCLPDDLCRAEAFPPPRPEAVTLASTHASWVFLTEREAWKVKRPVDYGFLDFSTAEKRRRCCEDEVRLGARLAEDVYLGVVPIHLGPAGYTFVGQGPVVDHAVRMRRLPDDQSAAALLAAGRLAPDHLQRLADRLADFYQATPATPELGAPAILAANIAENEAQLRPWCGRLVDGKAVETLFRWQEGQLLAHRARLQERIGRDRIREGHGDLRAEHVYFLDGKPVVIDPIEFNRAFRCADVALDVAFLAMELEAAGRRDLAAFFLSCFARASNDYHFYPLLDLYLSYRAQVRAKVACFVAGDPATPPEKARRKAEDAARLLALALSYRDPGPRVGHVVAIGGQIGTGKTTLADELARRLQLPVVSSDATRKHLGGIGRYERGGPALYEPAVTARTYEEVMRRGSEVLQSGRGVILDATFHDAHTRGLARGLAETEGRPFLFVELRGDEALLRARLRARESRAVTSDARESLLPEMLRAYDAPDEVPAAQHVRLDATLSPDALAAEVAGRLR